MVAPATVHYCGSGERCLDLGYIWKNFLLGQIWSVLVNYNTIYWNKHIPLWLKTTKVSFSLQESNVHVSVCMSGDNGGNGGVFHGLQFHREPARLNRWLPGLLGHCCSARWWRKEEWERHIRLLTMVLKKAEYIPLHWWMRYCAPSYMHRGWKIHLFLGQSLSCNNSSVQSDKWIISGKLDISANMR